jgi:hypothetical protein
MVAGPGLSQTESDLVQVEKRHRLKPSEVRPVKCATSGIIESQVGAGAVECIACHRNYDKEGQRQGRAPVSTRRCRRRVLAGVEVCVPRSRRGR